jgi:excisionase family DNA binding protein
MPRFLTLTDVAEILNISMSQTYALVHSGKLRAIRVGGRGQWRVEDVELEAYIAGAYVETENYLTSELRAGSADEAQPERT